MDARYSNLARGSSRKSVIFHWLCLVCIVTLTGCSAWQNTPTATPTPRPTDTATATSTATPLPLTPTPTISAFTPAPTLEGVVVHIQNVAQGTYLYETDHQAKAGQPALTDPISLWVIEDYQGSKRIRNQATGDYLSIEHLLDHVEAIQIESVWESPRWNFEQDPTSGATTIRNVWHNWQVLFTDPGKDTLQYGNPPSAAAASQWKIETTSGGALPTQTPVAVLDTPTLSQPLNSRGAAVPWIEYEAESGSFTGKLLGPDRTFGSIASEASGRQAVQLNTSGDYVQFTAQKAANSIVVRYVIPDSVDGKGITATLSLYVNGAFWQKLNLTSIYSWSYGGEASADNSPALGGAHHFFDETRALVKDIPAGANVMLRKDQDDAATYYVIDLVDLEEVGPAKTMPDGYLSITTDCGAIPDDGQDDGPAIQKCINLAATQGKGVWIPVGVFESSSAPFDVQNVTIQGAGMWYSTLHGLYARFNCSGNNCRYTDFAILGETTGRDDQSPDNGFNGAAGSGSRLENIWVEHTKVGYWVGGGMTDGLVIVNCRFRDLFADGVNFAGGTSNSMVENSHFRNTGDDALASWSQSGTGGVNKDNIFRFNTVQVPWRANCFAIYGGQDNKIENNLCYDVVTYPGILIAQSFDSTPFAGTVSVQRNSLIRAGGPMYQQEWGALTIWAQQGNINDILVKDLLIDAATFSGIDIQGGFDLKSANFDSIQITTPGTNGIYIGSSAAGKVSFTNVLVTKPGKDGLLNEGPRLDFTLNRGAGNSGW